MNKTLQCTLMVLIGISACLAAVVKKLETRNPIPDTRYPIPASPQSAIGNRKSAIQIGGPVSPDGATEVTCDLPVAQRIQNIGSRADGAGMCVMSSIEMSARWANLERLRGLRDWCAQQPGGGYPAKVDRQLTQYCQSQGIPIPNYVQYEGADPSLLESALKTGRMAAATYGGSDGVRYRGPIAHMVNLVHYDNRLACLLDNNGIGENELLWMDVPDFLKRWKSNGGGWAFVWLASPPPPVPHN